MILDFGFWKRSERDYFKRLALEMNVNVKLYNIQCPEDLRIKRVLERTNSLQPDAFIINENAINEFNTRYEPIDSLTEESILIKTY